MTKRAIKIRNQTGREGTERARERARKAERCRARHPGPRIIEQPQASRICHARAAPGQHTCLPARTPLHVPLSAQHPVRGEGALSDTRVALTDARRPGPVVSANERLTWPANLRHAAGGNRSTAKPSPPHLRRRKGPSLITPPMPPRRNHLACPCTARTPRDMSGRPG